MLIHCPECNKEISDQTNNCIYCGFPIKQQNKFNNIIEHHNEQEEQYLNNLLLELGERKCPKCKKQTQLIIKYENDKPVVFCGECEEARFWGETFKINIMLDARKNHTELPQSYCKNCKTITDSYRRSSIVTSKVDYIECFVCGLAKQMDMETPKQRKLEEEKENIKKQKEVLQTIQENKSKGIPCCPKCGSTAIQPVQKGFGLIRGFIGSGKVENYCMNCGNRWQPGK